MAAQRTSFEKLQRDRNKKAKAAQKRERRQSTDEPEEHSTDEVQPLQPLDDGKPLSAAVLLERIELIHKQLDNEEISFEEFEELKTDLMARLPID